MSNGIKVGKISTQQFDNYLLIPFSKDWLSLNDNNQIEFLIEIKEGCLVLSGHLSNVDRTRKVDTHDM